MEETKTMQEVILQASWLLPILVGLVEVAKQTFNIPTRFIPITALVLGVILALMIVQMSLIGVLVGIVLGLGSVGLWEFGKTTLAGKSSKK